MVGCISKLVGQAWNQLQLSVFESYPAAKPLPAAPPAFPGTATWQSRSHYSPQVGKMLDLASHSFKIVANSYP